MKSTIEIPHHFFIILFVVIASLKVNSQGVGIGTDAPHVSSVLDVSSQNKGILLPRAYLESIDSAKPVGEVTEWGNTISHSLLVFNTNYNISNGLSGMGFYWWDESSDPFEPKWRRLAQQTANWSLTGNNSIFDYKLGTLDNKSIPFRRNGKLAGLISNYNVKFGASATNIPQKGNSNLCVSFGVESSVDPHSSSFNTAFGAFSMQNDSSVKFSLAFGASAMAGGKQGENNVGIGYNALNLNKGNKNTAFGSQALYTNVNGSYNTGIGYATGALSNLFFATAVGAEAGVTSNNSLVLGGTGAAAVKVGIGITAPGVDLDILQKDDSMGIKLKGNFPSSGWTMYVGPLGDFVFKRTSALSYISSANGQLILISDSSAKKQIADMPLMLASVKGLQPKTYSYLSDKKHTQTMGFVAQEVENVFPSFVHSATDGYKGIAYNNFHVIAIKTIQEQQDILQEQETTITALRQRIERLELQKSKTAFQVR